jgi:hypothetical protein
MSPTDRIGIIWGVSRVTRSEIASSRRCLRTGLAAADAREEEDESRNRIALHAATAPPSGPLHPLNRRVRTRVARDGEVSDAYRG